MTNQPRTQVDVVAGGIKSRLVVNVIRACGKCGAPGFWHNTPGVNVGCYAPERVTKLGEDPVGPVCPNCGAERETMEPHGVVWQRTIKFGRTIKDSLKAAVGSLGRFFTSSGANQ